MNKIPLVSCIMTTFNSEEFLVESINSILNQSFTDFEFIISDWWSSDSTLKILKDFQKKDSRIIILENEKRKWIAECLNDCMKFAKGSMVAIMESDDASYPERFEHEYEKLIDSNSDLVMTSWESWAKIWKFDYIKRYNTNDFKDSIYCFCNPALIACWMFKRELFERIWWFWTYTWDVKFSFDCEFSDYNAKIEAINEVLYFKRDNWDWASQNRKKFFSSIKDNRLYAIRKYSLPKRFFIITYYDYYTSIAIRKFIILCKRYHIYSFLRSIWMRVLNFRFNIIR